MPTGTPRLGQAVADEHARRDAAEAGFPGGEMLGELRAAPSRPAMWDDKELGVQIAMEQGPPPWETQEENPSDARNFLDCPKEWVLRWINPRLLDQEGWRGWAPVRALDPRVTVKIPSMVSPEYHVRRGGHGGDILAYMPKHWYEARRTQYYKLVGSRTQSSVDKAASIGDEVRRIHPGITVDHVVHPTHTIGEIDKDAP